MGCARRSRCTDFINDQTVGWLSAILSVFDKKKQLKTSNTTSYSKQADRLKKASKAAKKMQVRVAPGSSLLD